MWGVDTVLNRANERFKQTLTSGATADDVRAEPGQFDPVLGDGEGVHHICSSTEGIEHETGNRTTTMEPGGDADAHLVVTDRRVLGVLGDSPNEAEIAMVATDIAHVKSRDGLLSSSLVVKTPEETVRFSPDDGSDVETVVATIKHVSETWEDLYEAVAGVEAAIEEYEQRVDDGADPDSALANVRSRLSQAHHVATKSDYTPEAEMLAEIEPVEDEVDRLRVSTRLDRTEAAVERAAAAEDLSETLEAAGEARAELDAARDVHGEVGSTTISQRLTAIAEDLAEVYDAVLDDAGALCAMASDADDPATAIDRWEMAQERYRTLLDDGWEEEAGVSADAIRFQLAWVVGNRVDALRERAAVLESEGDEAEDGSDQYESALAHLETARDIEAECPFGDANTHDAAVERVEEKVAKSEWQWGAA